MTAKSLSKMLIFVCLGKGKNMVYRLLYSFLETNGVSINVKPNL
jgi:hypothetical protein